jgi:hypothetical protein
MKVSTLLFALVAVAGPAIAYAQSSDMRTAPRHHFARHRQVVLVPHHPARESMARRENAAAGLSDKKANCNMGCLENHD